MIDLKKFHHSKTTHKALNSFSRNAISHLNAHSDDATIARHISNLLPTLDEMDKAFQRELVNDFTARIVMLDDRRDKLVIAINSAIRTAIAEEVFDPVRAEAAKELKKIADKMSARVTKLPYQEESAELRAFVTASRDNMDTLMQSGLVQHIDILDQTVQEFDLLYNEKQEAQAAQENIRQIRAIRAELTDRLDALLSHVRYCGIDMPDQYGQTVEKINGLIIDAMALGKADETRRENDNAEGEDQE